MSKDIRLVERSRLNDIMNELKLSESDFIDPQAAVKLGRGLGASYMVVGSYIIQDTIIRVDVVLDVETTDCLTRRNRDKL